MSSEFKWKYRRAGKCAHLIERVVEITISFLVFCPLLSADGLPDAPAPLTEPSSFVTSHFMQSPTTRKHGLWALTSMLIGADGIVRALDGYSTERMLKNRCNGDLSVPVCNEEIFLPDSITRSSSTLYTYEGAVWFTELVATRTVARRHRKLAALIPAINIATTLPFVIRNLRAPSR